MQGNGFAFFDTFHSFNIAEHALMSCTGRGSASRKPCDDIDGHYDTVIEKCHREEDRKADGDVGGWMS